MRARSAYISSLSTTAILVIAALLMLGLLGAIVGFTQWPHGAGGPQVDPIGVDQPVVPVAAAALVRPAATHVTTAASPHVAAAAVVGAHVGVPSVAQRAAEPAPAVSSVEVESSPPPAERIAPTPVATPTTHSQPASGPGAVTTPVAPPPLPPVVGPVTSTIGSVGGPAAPPVHAPALPG